MSADSFSAVDPNFERGIENHFSKSSQLEKTLGSKKLRRAHNSPRLFYNGVPVKRILKSLVYYYPKILANLLFEFFIL